MQYTTSASQASPITIKTLDSTAIDRWDSYVQTAAEATFFHKAGWATVLSQGLGHRTYYLYAEQDGRIRGVLPLGHIESLLFGNSLISTPFCVYGGAVADTAKIRTTLEDKAAALASELAVDYLELRNRTYAREDWPTKDLYVTFRKSIAADPEVNMKAIPRKQRAVVRKGLQAGFAAELDNEIDRFFFAYSTSVRNLGTPVFPRRFFVLLKRIFADDCEIMTVLKDGRIVSSVMSFYFRNEVLPYYGGGTDEARVLKANDFMYWELMRRAGERGIEVFDYGRSKRGTGAYDFKRNWGFEPEPLAYQYHLVNSTSVPDINPLNPKYRLFINVWKHLPLPLANSLGPLISRNLG